MRRTVLILALLLTAGIGQLAAQQTPASDWKASVARALPLLGHRNWILVVDSAYPLQTSPGVETIETNSDQLTVVKSVLDALHSAIHVRPLVYMDAELPFVPDQDAPGVSTYREQIARLLQGYEIQQQPHESILADIDGAGKLYHVLVLKTNMTIPYTSVFFRLDCKYWSADAEKRMRAKMSAAPGK